MIRMDPMRGTTQRDAVGEAAEGRSLGRRWLRPVAVIVLGMGLSPLFALPGLAADQDGADAVQPGTATLLFPGTDLIPFGQSAAGRFEAASERTSTTIEGATVTTSDAETGSSVSITPSDPATRWTMEGSAVVSTGAAIDYVVTADTTGAAVISVLDEDDPRTVQFDIDVSPGLILALDPDEGSVDIIGPDGVTVGAIEAPWAVDAEGTPVPTHYTLRGRRLTQYVEAPETAVFPIVADPEVTYGYVTGTIYFNKLETADIASAGSAVAVCAAIGTMGIVGKILGAVCAAQWGIWVTTANVAKNHNKCVKIKFGIAHPTNTEMHTYSGGYCTK